MEDLTADPRYREARRYACRLRGFYTHAFVFVAVNAGLFAINMMTTPHRWWFGWALFGWGIGLLAHAISVFALRGALGTQWEQRKIREYLGRRS